MIRIEKISKKFGNKKVLEGISLEIPSNSITGLLGPNGAGKTTLMRVMVGFLKANGGKISGMGGREEIGYLPENNPLYPQMTVNEYLTYIADLKGVGRKEIAKVIEGCGLKEYRFELIERLSKGFRQRVGLAAALLGEPKFLILDEPTSGLDPKQIVEIRKLIKKLAVKKTVILSTHILPEAKEICDKLAIINRGKIVLDEKTTKIRNLEKKFIQLTV